ADALDTDSVFLFDPVHQAVRLREQELRINREQAEVFAHAGRHVDQHHSLGAERRRNRNPVAKGRKGPGESMLGRPGFGNVLYLGHPELAIVLDRGLNNIFHATGSSEVESTWKTEISSSRNGISLLKEAMSNGSLPANRTTSPTISKVGADNLGESSNSAILVRNIRCSGVVARETIAHGVWPGSPALLSLPAISE